MRPIVLAAAVLNLFCCVVSAAEEFSQPNIVFVYTDDHAYQAIGAYGSQRGVTPQMDRLAAEGMIFTNCCVPNSICGPMRAVVQTGKYSHKNGFLVNEGGQRFNPNQQTFPKLLQKAGYATAIVGKWHLLCEATQGYDYSEVLIGQGPYFNPDMVRNGKRTSYKGYTTEIITRLSLDWLKNGRDKSKPFLLMCQHKATHREWLPTPKYYNRFKDRTFPLPATFWDDYAHRGRAALEQDMTIADTLTPHDLKLDGPGANWTDEQKRDWHDMYDSRIAEYKAMIARKASEKELAEWKYQCYLRDYLSVASAVDDSIGEITAYLKESGLDKNTIVVYSSDQGFYLGEHGWFDKRFMYEESFKTPLIVRWPGVIKPGQVNSRDIVSPLDFAETFLDAAGAKIPSDMQGASLIPIFRGERPADWRTAFYYHYYEYPAWHMVKKHEGIYDGRYKLIHFYDDIDEWELYDLATDPTELTNVLGDSKLTPVVERLKAELLRQQTVLDVPKPLVRNQSFVDRGVDKTAPEYVQGFQRTVLKAIDKRKARKEAGEK